MGLMLPRQRQLRTKYLYYEQGEFTLYGDDGQPFTAQWLWDANLHTPNLTNLGITGWARINGDVKRLHVCEHEPCRARWKPASYGVMPVPIHGQISPPASSSACANTQAVDTPPPAAEEPPPSVEEPPPAGNAPPPGAEESPSVLADSDTEPSHCAPSPQTPEIETPVPSPFSSPFTGAFLARILCTSSTVSGLERGALRGCGEFHGGNFRTFDCDPRARLNCGPFFALGPVAASAVQSNSTTWGGTVDRRTLSRASATGL